MITKINIIKTVYYYYRNYPRANHSSEAFPVDNGRTCFLVLCLCDPTALESGKRAQNRSSNPDKEFSLLSGLNLDIN